MVKRFLAVLLLAAPFLHTGESVLAAVWTGAAGSLSFDDPFNWDGGFVPGANDVAEFSNEVIGSFVVIFAGEAVTAQLDVLGVSGDFDLGASTYVVTRSATINGLFGAAVTGRLGVINGNLVAGNLSDPFRVGAQGSAELNIRQRATVTSQGQFEVGGSNNGASFVTVSDGGRLSPNQFLVIGGTSGQTAASGAVTITGSGSQLFLLSNLFVGGAGTGVLNIENSASAINVPVNLIDTTASTIIADEAGSTGTLNVSTGATFNDPVGIDVGRGGAGNLNIATGGNINSPTSIIARLPGSTGIVSIDGSNSAWLITGDLTIGGTSTAPGGVGTANVTNGGRLEATGDIRVRSGSQLGGDATIEAVNVNIDAGVRLSGTPSVQGNVSNSGTVAPGFSPGIMTISGDFIQNSDGVLEIEVEGRQPGIGHDQLLIDGIATLAGRLDVPVTSGPGFPVVGDEISFLQTNSQTGAMGVMGQFDVVTSPNLATEAPGLAIRANYLSNEVRLEFVAPISLAFRGQGGEWFTSTLWSGNNVPSSANSVQISNLNPFMPLDVSIVGPQNAVVHNIEVTGASQLTTLSIGGDNTLFANSNVAIGNNGVVSLTEGGTLTSPNVQVSTGGLLTGNGTINGNTVLGSGTGIGAATLSPGNSVGAIAQNGNLHIQCDGVVEIELEKDNASPGDPVHDVVDVSGEATFGGTLVLDFTNYAATQPIANTSLPTFDVITAGSRTAGTVFENVQMINAPANLGFDTVYTDGPEAPAPVVGGDSGSGRFAAAGSGSGSTVSVVGSFLGDMDWDGQLDEADDVQAFVLGLTDPFGYFTTIMDLNGDSHSPQVLGDVGGGPGGLPDGTLNFDDVDNFAALFSPLSAATIFEMINLALAAGSADDFPTERIAASHAAGNSACGVPEPTTCWLLIIGSTMLSALRTKRSGGSIGTSG